MPVISGGGGSGGSGLTQLAATVLAVDTATLSASGLAGTFTHLYVTMLLRSNRAAVNDDFLITLNGDGGAAHYFTSGNIYGGASANVSTNSTSFNGTNCATGDTATAGQFTSVAMDIPYYASANAKNLTAQVSNSRGGVTDAGVALAGLWTQTGAVTSITVAPGVGTAWRTGSAIAVYGI